MLCLLPNIIIEQITFSVAVDADDGPSHWRRIWC